MKKLAVANLCIALAMLFMLIVAEIFGVKHILGIFIGVFWVLLDVSVLIVSLVTGVLLWKSSRNL